MFHFYRAYQNSDWDWLTLTGHDSLQMRRKADFATISGAEITGGVLDSLSSNGIEL